MFELNTAAVFSWNKVSGATKYQLVFGTDESFSSFDGKKNKCLNKNTCATVTVSKTSYKLSKTHAFMKKEGAYFWKIRSYKGTTKSAFGEVYYFQVGEQPIEAPVQIDEQPKSGGAGSSIMIIHDPDDDVFFSKKGDLSFSYTKIANNGSTLPKTAKLGTGEKDWACTKDNNTGLIWEIKTDDGGLRDTDWRYSWYEPNPSKNGGFVGYKGPKPDSCIDDECVTYFSPGGGKKILCKGSECNTSAFANAVNKQGLCGAKDWRVPTSKELTHLFFCPYHIAYDYGGVPDGTVYCAGNADDDLDLGLMNTMVFPDAKMAVFWSSSPDDPGLAWSINFMIGNVNWGFSDDKYYLRLVRSGR